MAELQNATWPWPLLACAMVLVIAIWHLIRIRVLRTVFVSYRRSDSAAETARIVGALRLRFGRKGVFHDVVSIGPGANFIEVIAAKLRRCDATLVVIGRDWTTCTGTDGRPRLAAPHDVVRLEVLAALNSGALVVPVLVDGAPLPRLQQMPPELQRLLAHNALAVAGAHDKQALDALAAAIRMAPMRRDLAFLTLCHASVLVLLVAFRGVDGLAPADLTFAISCALPAIAAIGGAALVRRSRAPGRMPRVAPLALLAPLTFVAAISALAVLTVLSIVSPTIFRIGMAVLEAGFAAYTGGVLVALGDTEEKGDSA